MNIDYHFDDGPRAAFAKEALMGQQIFATLRYNVPVPGTLTPTPVHRVEVEEDNAGIAVDLLKKRGLMGAISL